MRGRKVTDRRKDIIKGRARLKGLGIPDLARRVGIPESTLYRKLNFPGGINLTELSIIDEIVEFTDEEILYFVRWRRYER